MKRLSSRIWAGGVLLLGCGAEAPVDFEHDLRSQDIIGGADAPVGAYPSVVGVSFSGSPQPPWWCGGTLIGDRWVLTAAHCLDNDPDPAEYEVIVGRHDITASDGQVVGVVNMTLHPDYEGLDNDIAVLELATPVAVEPARLVSPPRMSEIEAGDASDVLGWGDTTADGDLSEILQLVTLDVIGIGAACEAVTDYSNIVTNNEICIGNLAGGQDSCSGDSGGPAFVRRDGELFILGATSWGFGCAEPELPGVYTFVPNYFDWVHQVATTIPAPSWLPSAQIMVVAS